MTITTSILPTIAILGGTGKEGPGLAMRWVKAGYSIIIGSRLEEKAVNTANEINQLLNVNSIQGMENSEAARKANICVLTIVQSAHQQALEGLKNDLAGKIVVDATARVDFRDPKPPSPPSAARIAQDILGNKVRVVAAFQNVPAHVLKKNIEEPLNLDTLVCADDIQAAEEVIRLAEDGGMRAFYAGGLDNAIVVEGITALLININQYYRARTASIAITGLRHTQPEPH